MTTFFDSKEPILYDTIFDDIFWNRGVEGPSSEDDAEAHTILDKPIGSPSAVFSDSKVLCDNASNSDEFKVEAGKAFNIPSSLRQIIEGRRITYLDFNELPPNEQQAALRVGSGDG